jgi:hypothetical protein
MSNVWTFSSMVEHIPMKTAEWNIGIEHMHMKTVGHRAWEYSHETRRDSFLCLALGFSGVLLDISLEHILK